MSFITAELIKKKREGYSHTSEEINFLIQQFVDGNTFDYQIAAWLMAVFFQGASPLEISALTQVMRDSGITLDFSSLNRLCVDKHSTGGIGDKTSLILAPIVAASGVPVPMISGRGLGYTGGTLDKLSSIPDFRIMLNKKEIEERVKEINIAIVGQTSDICPADKKLYALRDVTGTVDSRPLMCSSIMSKKLAEGIGALVLDIKFGSGAFMKSLLQAEVLAKLLIYTGESHNVRTVAFLTDMNQPLGRYIGNALEVKECIEIMKGKKLIEGDIDFYENTRRLSLELAGQMIYMGGKASSPLEGMDKAKDILNSGAAYDKFTEMCYSQGASQVEPFPLIDKIHEVTSPEDGFINQINGERLGWIAVELGIGRKFIQDKIDLSTGIEWCCQVGQKVTKGQVIAKVYCTDLKKSQKAAYHILQAVHIGEPCQPLQLIAKKLGKDEIQNINLDFPLS